MCNFKNIVFVDDDEDDRMVFREILQRVYPEIIYNDFDGAEEALSFLECEFIMQPDLIFLDINMPVKDGFFMLRSLKKKERLKSVPVVVFSTSKNPTDMEKAKKLGAVGYAVKPSEIAGIMDVIKTASEKIIYSDNPAKNLMIL